MRDQVSAGPILFGDALPSQPQLGSILRTRRYRELNAALWSRDGDLRTVRGLQRCHWKLHVELLAPNREMGVLADFHPQLKIDFATEKLFDFLPGINPDLLKLFSTAPDDNAFLGITFNE